MSKVFRGVLTLVLGATVVIAGLQVVVNTQTNPYRRVDGLQAGEGPGRLHGSPDQSRGASVFDRNGTGAWRSDGGHQQGGRIFPG